jgi:hypothetical protein
VDVGAVDQVRERMRRLPGFANLLGDS